MRRKFLGVYNRMQSWPIDHANVPPMPFIGEHKVQVVRVIDGDTVQVVFYHGSIPTRINIRVLDIDTPEIRGAEKPEGLKAMSRVEQLLPHNSIHNCKIHTWDKFGGRVLGEIFIDGESLTDILLREELGVSYHGGKKVKKH